MREGDQRRELGTVMDEIAQYRTYADECGGLAATAKRPEHKTQLLEMAAVGIPSSDSNERAEAFERGRFDPKSVKS
jgi:hypothetical protein